MVPVPLGIFVSCTFGLMYAVREIVQRWFNGFNEIDDEFEACIRLVFDSV